jgi:hypothetical protein
VALALAVLAAAPEVFAQQEPRGGSPGGQTSAAEIPEAARTRYAEALRAYKEARYKDAIDLFIEVDRIFPSAALSFNIARAYGKIGDTASSLAWYRDYLRRAQDARDRGEIEATVSELARKLVAKGVQQVTVLSEPLGATVVVDDRPLGVTPWTGELPPGRHRIALRLRGFQDAERMIELEPQTPQDVSLRLVPAAPDAPSAPVPAPPPSPTAPEPSPVPDPVRDEPGVRPLSYIVLGAGVVTLGVAGGFELARRSAADDAESDRTQVGRAEKLQTADDQMTTARILAGVGGALIVTGVVLLAVDLGRDSSPQAAFGIVPRNDGLGIFGSTRF